MNEEFKLESEKIEPQFWLEPGALPVQVTQLPESTTFDYVKYDERSNLVSSGAKNISRMFEHFIKSNLPNGRYRALALTKLEECFMHIGKAVREQQYEREKVMKGEPL